MKTQAASCQIVVINDVLGTRVELESPQTPKEAMDNHGLIRPAMGWARYHQTDNLEVEKLLGSPPIACSIHQTADTVIVHWHAIGDPKVAQDAMRAILDGTWREGELL